MVEEKLCIVVLIIDGKLSEVIGIIKEWTMNIMLLNTLKDKIKSFLLTLLTLYPKSLRWRKKIMSGWGPYRPFTYLLP